MLITPIKHISVAQSLLSSNDNTEGKVPNLGISGFTNETIQEWNKM